MAGRRPGAPDTKKEIVTAARTELAQRGYDGTSIRAVARRARVDPALVHHYFKDKGRLVAAALALPDDPSETLAPVMEAAPDEVGCVLVRTLLESWDDPDHREALVAMARSGLGSADQGALLSDFMLSGPVAAVLERHRPDAPPEIPALLLGQIVGLLVTRYLLELEPFASMSVVEVADRVGPVVQHQLDLDVAGARG